jgi:signal transduction histidine kinase
VITGLLGILLMRSVKKEVKQRQEIENLAQSLARVNERLEQLDKQKSEFVSIASHQLRSPLTAIRGYASLLLESSYGKLPETALEPLQRIEESSRLMTYAIEDYLNVSRIESGNMKYNFSDFNLRDQVEHICDDLRSDAIKHGLVLIFRTDMKSKGIINADLGKTVQIVQNLINNAIKYTENGSIKVLVRDDVVRKKIYVDIIDTGIGMSETTRASLFQKFERAHNANSVNVHGTGLGLYVALMMAKAMKGDIRVKSEGEGKGSCFTVEFPLAL